MNLSRLCTLATVYGICVLFPLVIVCIFDYLSVCLVQYMQGSPEISLKGGKIIPADQLQGRVLFDHVYFSYPGRPDQVG